MIFSDDFSQIVGGTIECFGEDGKKSRETEVFGARTVIDYGMQVPVYTTKQLRFSTVKAKPASDDNLKSLGEELFPKTANETYWNKAGRWGMKALSILNDIGEAQARAAEKQEEEEEL